MKKRILTFIIAFLGVTVLHAAGYEENLLKAKEKFNSATTLEQTVEAVNTFERIAEANKGEWLPLYYASYACLSAGFQQEDVEQKDQWYQKGLAFIERGKAVKKEESELLAMEAYLKLMYISNKPMLRAPTQTGEALALIKQAKALDPSNPRPWLIQGQNTFYTPSFFGGGSEKAKPLLEKAAELYKTFTPATKLMPTWGKERCEKLLKECVTEDN